MVLILENLRQQSFLKVQKLLAEAVALTSVAVVPAVASVAVVPAAFVVIVPAVASDVPAALASVP